MLKKGVVCEILEWNIKAAVRRGDMNNGITVHTWDHQHRVDRENASVLKQEPEYWKTRVLEAIQALRSRDMLGTQTLIVV